MDNRKLHKFIVAGSKPWNRRVFDEVIQGYPGLWEFVSSPAELLPEKVKAFGPRFIFFLHWSWRVPPEIVDAYECVCFHMTDLPFGRGGSPLQNLISLGLKETKLTALRMTSEIDQGPVYVKKKLMLNGNAEEIYIRSSLLAAQIIDRIIRTSPSPLPQKGKDVKFLRRKPEQSEIPEMTSLFPLYDFLRMLDADGYPKAFFDHKGFRYEFSRAALYDGRIEADVTITPVGDVIK